MYYFRNKLNRAPVTLDAMIEENKKLLADKKWIWAVLYVSSDDWVGHVVHDVFAYRVTIIHKMFE